MWGKKAHQNLSSAVLTLTCAKGQGLVCVCVCSVMSNVATLWTVARQPPLFLGLPRQEYWGVTISFSRDPGIKTVSLTSPALAGGFFTTSATWEAQGLF